MEYRPAAAETIEHLRAAPVDPKGGHSRAIELSQPVLWRWRNVQPSCQALRDIDYRLKLARDDESVMMRSNRGNEVLR